MSTVTGSISDVRKKYDIMEVLGAGAFGVVHKCQHRVTGEYAAVKTIEKTRVGNIELLQREISLLKEVNHPHIIQLYDVYEDNYCIHLVTELCTGGELYDKVVEKAESEEGHFQEDDVGILVRDILDAIRYIHDELNIVHRDLKPENFLLTDPTDDAAVKIIDFGLSRKNDADFGLMTSRVGTPYYVAPEVLTDSYNYKCDIWSIGIITYILLCGFAPFAGESDADTLHMVKHGELEFPSPEWDDVSDSAISFVKSLLHREPYQRPTAAEALQHPWIAQFVTAPGVPEPRPFMDRAKSEPFVKEIRMDSDRRNAFQRFLANLKLEKAMNGAVHILSPNEAKQLGEVFRKVDHDKDGKIDATDIDEAVHGETKDVKAKRGALPFSTSVQQSLLELKRVMTSYPKFSLDIRPYIKYMDRRSQSESNV